MNPRTPQITEPTLHWLLGIALGLILGYVWGQHDANHPPEAPVTTMTDTRFRLTSMWLTAMNYDSGLTAGTRLHLEWLLGNEYRHTPRCRECAAPTDRDADHAQAAA